MSELQILYSTNTLLAYRIAQKYYRGIHYVWCAPYFNRWSIPTDEYLNPPSASPAEIYKNLLEVTAEGDRHSSLIAGNKSGIRHGAIKKREAGVIDDRQLQEINWIVNEAQVADFSPLVFIIPYTEAVARITQEVHPQDKAHPFSAEYLIEKLPRSFFHILKV